MAKYVPYTNTLEELLLTKVTSKSNLKIITNDKVFFVDNQAITLINNFMLSYPRSEHVSKNKPSVFDTISNDRLTISCVGNCDDGTFTKFKKLVRELDNKDNFLVYTQSSYFAYYFDIRQVPKELYLESRHIRNLSIC